MQTATPLLILIVVIWWNIATLPLGKPVYFPSQARTLIFSLQLSQHWGLFAPEVNTREGYFLAILQFCDGTILSVNPINQEPKSHVEFTNSKLKEHFVNDLWRSYLLDLFHSRDTQTINEFAYWIVEEWNEENPYKVALDLQLLFYLQDDRYPEEGINPVQVYPITSTDGDGKAIYVDDLRR